MRGRALVVLVEGNNELTESFHADVADVAQRGKHDRCIREFVAAELDHVLELDLFYLHVAGGAAGAADDAGFAGEVKFLGEHSWENEGPNGVAGVEVGFDLLVADT